MKEDLILNAMCIYIVAKQDSNLHLISKQKRNNLTKLYYFLLIFILKCKIIHTIYLCTTHQYLIRLYILCNLAKLFILQIIIVIETVFQMMCHKKI